MTESLNIGERISFTQLLEDSSVVIPLIQRDYVQGRASEEEVRSDFLNALLGYLKVGKPFQDLDFIYGFLEDNNVLYPLDGQQRLTTLMLLHWYLANKENQFQVYQQKCLDKTGSIYTTKFSYENRTSSKEFCHNLFATEMNFGKLLSSDKGTNNSLSKTIKDFNWYALIWDYDPTVRNILDMLDAMHQLFLPEEKFFERLVDSDQPVITFLFMDLGKNNLSDDLYIKMNSRGIPLSPFENFKAKLESFIKASKITKDFDIQINEKVVNVDFLTYYSNKLDNEWSNLVWNTLLSKDIQVEHPEKFDLIWTNIYRISFLHSLLNTTFDVKEIEPVIRVLLTNPKQLSFYDYSKCFQTLNKQNIDLINLKSVTDFVEFLDLLDSTKGRKCDFDYFSFSSVFYELITSDYKTAKYQERLLFYSFTKFLFLHKGGFLDDSLHSWMRFIKNMVNSTAPYNNIQEYLNSVNVINVLVNHSLDIDSYLANQNFNEINGFDSGQYKEEVLKRKLEKIESSYRTLFCEAELHPYLEGQINFLLMLSGIQENTLQNIVKENSVEIQKEFNTYFKIFQKLFTANGLNQEYSSLNNFRFERALLAIGDYTIAEGSNKSFLIDRDRDISWKRFLKFDKKIEHQEIIQTLFGGLKKYIENLGLGLQEIIYANHVQEPRWRNLIINNPGILNFYKGVNKRYFRGDTNHGFVLLKGERLSGSHAELESYNFYLNAHDGFKFKDYYSVSGENNGDQPCAYLDIKVNENFFGIDIRFDKQFNIAVKCRNPLKPYDSNLQILLYEEAFQFESYFFKDVGSYEDCAVYLKLFIEKVNALNND